MGKQNEESNLRRLARRAEALAPQTPAARLAELLETVPHHVLQNPALPLLLVEEPDFWARLHRTAAVMLSTHDGCPVDFARWLLRRPDHDGFYARLYANAALPMPVRREAFLGQRVGLAKEDLDPAFFREAFRDVVAPAEQALLERAGLYPASTEHGTLLPQDPAMGSDAVLQLFDLGALGMALAARHPAVTDAALQRLLAQGVVNLHQVARHPSLAPERLAAFLASPQLELQKAAALNPSLTAEQFRAAFEDPALLPCVAWNPGLPAELRDALLHSPRAHERAYLAANPRLPVDVQLQLERDPERKVRVALRHNPRLDPELHRRLKKRAERNEL
jgi:hypothetical protein